MSSSASPSQGPSPSDVAASPFREMLAIAAPTVVTMTSYTLMQALDKLMASRIDPDPVYVGATGNGGLAAWVPISIAMGFITVVNTYVAQHMGAGQPQRGPAYAWNALWISLAWWLLLIPYAILLPRLFHVLWFDPANPDPALDRRIELSTAYGRPLVLASVLTMGSRAIWQYFYGMHKASVVLLAGLAGNLVNAAANSILIYGPHPPDTGYTILNGWFGLTRSLAASLHVPTLGVAGAAYGTILGAFVETIIPLAIFLSPSFHRRFATRLAWRPSVQHLRDLFKIGWPGALMFGNEMLCWGLFMVYFVGHFGTDHSTAGWIAHQWMALSFMPTIGISIAATATVGKYMGMKRPDIAARRAWLAIALAVAWMSFMGALFVALRHPMINAFIDPATTPDQREILLHLGTRFMIAVAAFQFFDGLAMSIIGALRGAGDTVFPGVVTLFLSWSIIVGGGWVAIRHFPELSSLGPWIAAATYITLLGLIVLARFLSGKWKSIDLLKHTNPAATA